MQQPGQPVTNKRVKDVLTHPPRIPQNVVKHTGSLHLP
jgi:hypothetical protein